VKPVRVGCSGWNYRDWKDRLYAGAPQREWLQRYAEVFDTVEVNNTFYRLPSTDAVSGWATATPASFTFAIKMSRYITHIKRLASPERPGERLLERLEPLSAGSKLGPILWQLPPNFKRDDDRLGATLENVAPGRHCFEFRHPSWFTAAVYDLLRDAGAALVIGDDPEMPFQAHEITTDWCLIRFHRGSRGRRGKYSARELETWKRRIAGWRSDVEIYAYFNNDWEGFAVDNALWLKQHLS
jgi:uncharacterized protein YecE (DUF72 family)